MLKSSCIPLQKKLFTVVKKYAGIWKIWAVTPYVNNRRYVVFAEERQNLL